MVKGILANSGIDEYSLALVFLTNKSKSYYFFFYIKIAMNRLMVLKLKGWKK